MATYDDGHTIVTKNGETNCLDKFGKPFCPEWYDRFSFHGQHAIVRKENKENVIEVGGRVIGKEKNGMTYILHLLKVFVWSRTTAPITMST